MHPAATLFLIACITFSCGTREEKNRKARIIQLLAHRKKGLEENDVQSYLSTVSRNYNDGIDTYGTLKKKAEKFLTPQARLRLNIEKRTIYIDKNRATVIEEYRLSGFLPSGKKLSASRQGVFHLKYDDADGWKIVNGINEFSFFDEARSMDAPH